MELNVRVGTPDDVDQCMSLAMLACEENGFLVPEPVMILEHIWSALNQHQGIIGIIGEPGGLVEGAVLLRIGNLWYAPQEVIEEKGIFIHPEYRSAKGGRARRLCEFSKQVADTLGLPLVIGVLSNLRTQAKVKMYQRQFGEPAGAFWLYGAETGKWHEPSLEQTQEAGELLPVT